MDKIIDLHKLLLQEIDGGGVNALTHYKAIQAMKRAIRVSIPIILEEAATNAKVKISRYPENGKVSTVNKESILDLKDELIKKLDV